MESSIRVITQGPGQPLSSTCHCYLSYSSSIALLPPSYEFTRVIILLACLKVCLLVFTMHINSSEVMKEAQEQKNLVLIGWREIGFCSIFWRDCFAFSFSICMFYNKPWFAASLICMVIQHWNPSHIRAHQIGDGIFFEETEIETSSTLTCIFVQTCPHKSQFITTLYVHSVMHRVSQETMKGSMGQNLQLCLHILSHKHNHSLA